MVKILFFGLGSIGKRHARLIKQNYDSDLFAFRTNKGQEKNNLSIREFNNLDDAFEINPNIVFITNPTSIHIKTALKCAEKGIDMFIEKPLSNSMAGIEKLKGLVSQNNLFVYVGQCMRFHPVINYLKKNIEIQDILYAKTIATSYLPDWRPNQDYRNSYSVDPNKGGGILLDLIHEIDYNYWLFGDIDKISGKYGILSNLESSSEDFAELILKFKTDIVGSIHLNWFSQNNERRIQIYCSNKYIEGDLVNNNVIIKEKNRGKKIIHFNLERDDIYKAQLDYFFDAYSKRIVPMNEVSESANILEKVFNFKKESEFINWRK